MLARINQSERYATEGPGWTWWKKFKLRHKDKITLRKPDILDRGRARMARQDVMDDFFSNLKETLTNNNLLNRPECIFNCDESGFSMEAKLGKVVVPKGAKHSYSQSKGSRTHITTHVCVSASGQVLPPMIIYTENWPSAPYVREGPLKALYATQQSIYITTM